MIRPIIYLILLLCSFCPAQIESGEIDQLEIRIKRLESEQASVRNEISRETSSLERRMKDLEDNASAGLAVFASGILCALWAQYTRRSAWLWFFFGLLLAPIALIAMAWKNADGLRSRELRFWTREH